MVKDFKTVPFGTAEGANMTTRHSYGRKINMVKPYKAIKHSDLNHKGINQRLAKDHKVYLVRGKRVEIGLPPKVEIPAKVEPSRFVVRTAKLGSWGVSEATLKSLGKR